jgi:hypothetical protein
MASLWFVCSHDVVSGPFDTAQVKAHVASGQFGAECFIWWKGQREWIPLATWEAQLDSITQAMAAKPETPVWHVEYAGEQRGPLTHAELIHYLKALPSFNGTDLWAVGMPQWKSIFEMPDIMEEVGISRRTHERAPLMASVALSRSNDVPKTFMMKAASISIAGMGVTGENDLRRGDEVSLILKSTSFPMPLRLQGTIAYLTREGYVGIRFSTVHPEAQSIIMDYVKRFIHDQSAAKAA